MSKPEIRQVVRGNGPDVLRAALRSVSKLRANASLAAVLAAVEEDVERLGQDASALFGRSRDLRANWSAENVNFAAQDQDLACAALTAKESLEALIGHIRRHLG